MKTNILSKIAVTLMLAIVAAFSLHAEDMKKEKVSMKGGCCMVDGKMIHMDAEGKYMVMDKTMTLEDGTQVMKDGSVVKKSGDKMTIKEGEMMTKDGKVMMMDDEMKKNINVSPNRQ